MQKNAGELFREILSEVVENTVKELGAGTPATNK